MRDTPMGFNINLRTGFFKSEPYIVAVSCEALVFTRAGDKSGGQFQIDCTGVKGVAIFGKMPSELEIRMAEEVLTGTFPSPADAAAAATILRLVFGKRFLEESF